MAFNDAMADLVAGRTDYALVGGASNILRAHTSIAFQRLHMLSPEARPAALTTSPEGCTLCKSLERPTLPCPAHVAYGMQGVMLGGRGLFRLHTHNSAGE